ncbi:MAG TPA: thiol-disulfide isomerase [Bryobacteraceae bacterium]
MRSYFVCAALLAGASVLPATQAPASPTFNRDIAPILQQNCQGCHRPGEAGPMPLLTYRQVRPYAAAIKEAVALRKMPPWFADPHFGKFSNDRSLPQRDIDTIIAWVRNGAPEGDGRDLPKPAAFVDGWNIRQPDVVLEMPAPFHVPAKGTLEYQYILIPLHFRQDTWVQMAEVRPGDRTVVHHVIAWVRPPGSKWMEGIREGVPFVPEDHGAESKKRDADFLVGYAPGMPPAVLPEGRAKLIRAGSDIIFEMHYTATGKAATDRSRIGLAFAQKPVRERIVTLAASKDDFAIPPGAADYQVDAEIEFAKDTRIIDLMPHMHLRGKNFEFKALYPTGESQTLLRVPHYSFSWQLVYYSASDIRIPKGTRLHCTAHFDNSANNPWNPDPSKEVRWGEQSWDEMMIGFFDVAIPKDMDVRELFPAKPETKTAAAVTERTGR